VRVVPGEKKEIKVEFAVKVRGGRPLKQHKKRGDWRISFPHKRGKIVVCKTYKKGTPNSGTWSIDLKKCLTLGGKKKEKAK